MYIIYNFKYKQHLLNTDAVLFCTVEFQFLTLKKYLKYYIYVVLVKYNKIFIEIEVSVKLFLISLLFYWTKIN